MSQSLSTMPLWVIGTSFSIANKKSSDSSPVGLLQIMQSLVKKRHQVTQTCSGKQARTLTFALSSSSMTGDLHCVQGHWCSLLCSRLYISSTPPLLRCETDCSSTSCARCTRSMSPGPVAAYFQTQRRGKKWMPFGKITACPISTDLTLLFSSCFGSGLFYHLKITQNMMSILGE